MRSRTARITLGTVVVAVGVGVGGPGVDNAHGALRSGIVVHGAETATFVAPRLGPGAPLAAVKPPYPEECGLGQPGPFSSFCDVVPLTVEIPDTVRPSDDLFLRLWLTWPGSGSSPNPSSNLDFWLWDDGQLVAAKQPIPEFNGGISWTPAEVTSEYTMLNAGTGSDRPEYIEVYDPFLGHYNLVVANFNSRLSPQPSGPCPVWGGPAGCYVIEARLEIIPFEPPFEITGP